MGNKENRIFLSCYYIFFVNGILALLIGSLLPSIRESNGLDYGIAGFLISAHAAGNLVSSFLSSVVAIRIGRKKMMIIFGLAGVFAFLGMTLTQSPLLLILAFFLTGINRGAISYFNNSVINDLATGKAWALNILHATFSIGAFIAPFLVIAFTSGGSEYWVYVALLEAGLLFSTVVLAGAMDVPNNFPASGENKGAADLSFLKNKYFIVATGILFTYLCAEQAINGWLVTYLQDAGIMSAKLSQMMSGVLWLVILGGRLLSALLSRKIKNQYLLLGMGLGFLIFTFMLIFIRIDTITTFAVIGIGFFMAGIYPTNISSVGSIIKTYPSAMSFLLTLGSLGAIIMPVIIGVIARHGGIIGGMSVIFIAVVINFILMIINTVLRRGQAS